MKHILMKLLMINFQLIIKNINTSMFLLIISTITIPTYMIVLIKCHKINSLYKNHRFQPTM